METTFDVELQTEIASRLAEMEKSDYEFPQQATNTDWIAIWIIIVASFVLVMFGAFGLSEVI